MRKTAIGAIITMVSSVEELAREFTMKEKAFSASTTYST
jgi:hypothetical protein